MTTPSTHPLTDPAHPDQPNNDHTTTSGEKPTTAFAAITDPEFIPTLDAAPVRQHIKAYFVIVSLIVGGVLGAWLFGFDLFQTSPPDAQIPFQAPEPIAAPWIKEAALLGSVIVGLLLLFGFVGAFRIDWWELVLGYWWLSMPAAGAAGVFFVLMQETSNSMTEVS